MIDNQKGMTLVELVVAMSILGLIFVSMMNVFDKSIQLGNKISLQSMTQMDASKTLDQMIDGFRYNGQSLPGLRSTSTLDILADTDNHAVAYLITDKIVSYYLNGTGLYRVVVDSVGATEALVYTSGGTEVLRHVKTFDLSPDGRLSGGQLLDITLETENVSNTGIKLSISIFKRNY